ncbi:hypothetical protein A2W14_02105 [Candidatus Gottesmanbacteria bacterium RBG_16_37_8]|uniref:SpoVT-AbrB domain-containing protein n=1 Tax=Candidatus Gottesmanbacteria bacterium RBG_16_37_8 TaxID=1798371 RepID=A0A1F5YRW2_9BACT|nr:MAG: hypothetical protein A2W14_02105 [Candidatus Gottesmanbacteria bacterium RBG_16_37_8]
MTTVTVRQRGQLTIPDNIRESISWLKTGSPISMIVSEDEIKIKPFQQKEKALDWQYMWRQIELTRSFKGKKGNLSQFIVKDRETH